jgi:hypothetical protein
MAWSVLGAGDVHNGVQAMATAQDIFWHEL